jgi:hypothetical protein
VKTLEFLEVVSGDNGCGIFDFLKNVELYNLKKKNNFVRFDSNGA